MTVFESLTTLRFPSTTPRNRVERLLAHFVDVRAGEGVGALLFALNLFLLLASYYMLKTAREALILSEGGAEVKSYSAAGQAILLLVIIPLYGAFASKVSRVRLVTGAMLFFLSNLALFIGFGRMGFHEGIAFFLWACSTYWSSRSSGRWLTTCTRGVRDNGCFRCSGWAVR
jgi:hypothetical protein